MLVLLINKFINIHFYLNKNNYKYNLYKIISLPINNKGLSIKSFHFHHFKSTTVLIIFINQTQVFSYLLSLINNGNFVINLGFFKSIAFIAGEKLLQGKVS